LLADISGEEVLRQMFRDGLDYHLETAKKAFNNPNLTKDSPERRLAKNVGFAIAFGGGASTVTSRYGVPSANAKDMVAKYFKTFPTLKEYFDEVGNKTRAQGYVLIDMVLGRKSYLPKWDLYRFVEKHKDLHPKYASLYKTLKAEYQRISQNYRPQGTGASISKLAGVYMREAQKKRPIFELILLVHDEWVVMCKEQDALEVKDILSSSMEKAANVFCKSLPIPAEAKITRKWIK